MPEGGPAPLEELPEQARRFAGKKWVVLAVCLLLAVLLGTYLGWRRWHQNSNLLENAEVQKEVEVDPDQSFSIQPIEPDVIALILLVTPIAHANDSDSFTSVDSAFTEEECAQAVFDGLTSEAGVVCTYKNLAESLASIGSQYGIKLHSNESHANPNYLPHYHPCRAGGITEGQVHIWFLF